MTDTAVSAFSVRLAFWTSQGKSGAALYEALANDSELPTVFDPNEIAAIRGIKPNSVKRERMRGAGPAFIRMTERQVRYPRDEFCRYLASKFVQREAA